VDDDARRPATSGGIGRLERRADRRGRRAREDERLTRQVPLTPRAGAVLDRPPLRLDTPRLFPAPAGGLLNLQELADSAEQATAVPD
jgi:hypothetical protein